MTTINGNLADGDWLAYMKYEKESTSDSYTVRVTSAGTYISNVTWINQAWKSTLSATGKDSVSKSIGAVYLNKGDHKKIVSGVFTWTKGTESAKKTVKVTTKNTTTGSVSSADIEVTVPALARYSVKYYANGGSDAPDAQTKYYGRNLKLSSVKPKRTGYTFMGWGESAGSTKVSRKPGDTYTKNASVSFYAIWKKTLTLSYDVNSGTGSPQSQSADIYNNTLSYSFKIPSVVPSRSMYDFIGWSSVKDSESAEYQPGDTIDIKEDTILYAAWKLAYKKPSITLKKAIRCSSSFEPDDEGEYGVITVDWKVDDIDPNIVIRSLAAECTSDSSVNIIMPSPAASGKTGTAEIRLEGLAKDEKYDFVVTVTDSTSNEGNIAVCEAFISVAYFTMDFREGGYGIGIGCSADEGDDRDSATFKCAMNAKFCFNGEYRSLLDLIYPVGSYLYSSKPKSEFDPNIYYGGEWERITAKRFLLANDDETGNNFAEDGGYENTVAVPEHKHSVKSVSISAGGSHRHEYNFTKEKWGTSTSSGANYVLVDSTTRNALENVSQVKSQTHSHTVPSHTTEVYGSQTEGSNMPPYRVANLWHRKG